MLSRQRLIASILPLLLAACPLHGEPTTVRPEGVARYMHRWAWVQTLPDSSLQILRLTYNNPVWLRLGDHELWYKGVLYDIARWIKHADGSITCYCLPDEPEQHLLLYLQTTKYTPTDSQGNNSSQNKHVHIAEVPQIDSFYTQAKYLHLHHLVRPTVDRNTWHTSPPHRPLSPPPELL
jgi:hypothetical protein